MKSFLNFFTGLICIIICMVVYIFEIALLLIYSIQGIIGFKTVNNLFQNIEVKSVLTDIYDSGKLMDELYDSAGDIGINNSTVDRLLDSPEVKSILAQYVSNVLNYIATEGSGADISVNNLKAYADTELGDIIRESNPNISDEELSSALIKIDKLLDNLIKKLPDKTLLDENIDKTSLNYIRIALSNSTKCYLFVAIGINILLIMLLRFSWYKWLSWFGITTVFASLIGLLLSVIPMLDFSSLIPGMPLFVNNLINSSTEAITNNFIIPSAIMIITGITSIILYFVFRKVSLKKEN